MSIRTRRRLGSLEENYMKKTTLMCVLSAVFMLVLISMSINIRTVAADSDYEVKHVDHTVEVLYNGYVLINDTVEMSAQISGNFLLGIPNDYGPYVLRCIAYETQDRSVVFPVTLGVPFENHLGFYGVQVDFSGGSPQVFTVEFVLSNLLLLQDAQNETSYTLTFPGFPSLTKTMPVCNGSIVLPKGAQYLGGTVDSFNYGESDIAAFAYNESVVRFYLPVDQIKMFDITRLNRQIRIDESGGMAVSDSYYIENKELASAIDFVNVVLPFGASEPSAKDQFDRTLSKPVLAEANTTRYTLTFELSVEVGKSTRFTVDYDLPRGVYVERLDAANSFALNITLFENVDYFIGEASVTFVLPDGAKLLNFEDSLGGGSYSLERSVIQESATIISKDIISLDGFSVGIAYEYSPLWAGFAPTLWVWALMIVGCAVVAVWRRPRAAAELAAPSAAMKLRPEYIKSFVDSYEEKIKIISEIDSLEARVRRGRIPRRRYKVRRRTLETRISTLSRSLEELKGKMHLAGGHYSDLMRQLEIAETEMNEVETNLKSIEARHSRGELSLEAYRKLLSDYKHRKEKSETTIDGALLRLREEIR
jgi:hypothetical protein